MGAAETFERWSAGANNEERSYDRRAADQGLAKTEYAQFPPVSNGGKTAESQGFAGNVANARNAC